MAGLEDITSGDLSIGGKHVNDVPPSQRGVAMVFQSYALYPHMTIFDNMAFGLKLAKQDSDEIKNRVHWAAKILQMEHLLDQFAQRAFRRPAPAGRHRPGHRAQARRFPVRRAPV